MVRAHATAQRKKTNHCDGKFTSPFITGDDAGSNKTAAIKTKLQITV